jgi:hypothetical protein
MRFGEMVWRETGNRRQYITTHPVYILDTKGYKHMLRICNIVFPLQAWSHERASVLRYTSIACLVYLPFTLTYQSSTVTCPAGTGARKRWVVDDKLRPLYIQKRDEAGVGLGAALGGSGKSGSHRCSKPRPSSP